MYCPKCGKEINDDAVVCPHCAAAIPGVADTQPAPREVTRLTIDELAANLNGTERRCFLLMAEGADDKELERELGLKHRSVVQMRHNIKKKLQKYSERWTQRRKRGFPMG